MGGYQGLQGSGSSFIFCTGGRSELCGCIPVPLPGAGERVGEPHGLVSSAAVRPGQGRAFTFISICECF